MQTVQDFLDAIPVKENRQIIVAILNHIKQKYPDLKLELKWKQPMFVLGKTFIIGFSVAKNHYNIAPEKYTLDKFTPYLEEKKIKYTKMLIQFAWNEKINYELIDKLIEFNMVDKADYENFWR